MTYSMSGQTITAIERPYTVVDIATREGGLLRIENDYVLERPGQPPLRTDAGQEDEILRILGSYVGRPFGRVDTTGGRLTVELPEDARLVVEVTPAGEAWSLSGPHGELVVCTPGGELAIWDARR